MLLIFAHAGEIHTSTAEAATHANILPAFLLLTGITLVASVLAYWMLSNKDTITRDDEDEK